ncbi:MAG: hypothetical protein QM820_34015 [Minicystis sp.]
MKMAIKLPGIGRAWKPTTTAPPPLPVTFQPAFTRWVDKASFRRREIAIGRETATNEPWEVLTFQGDAVDEVWKVVESIDGTCPVSKIADATGQSADEVVGFVQRLYHAGVVDDVSGAELPAQACYEHLRSAYKFTLAGWGRSPLLQRFWTGPVSPRLALGYLIETYHFAGAASSHQGAAVASAPTERLKTAFSEHLSAEYWHYVWLRRGLAAAGLTDDDFERAAPLPATLGMINHLCWLATCDPLAYSACIGVTERSAGSVDVYKRFWDRFGSHGALQEAVYAPFREHELLDCAENHDMFGAEPFVERGSLNQAEVRRIRQRLLAYARLSHELHRQILEWYEAAEGPRYFTLEEDMV